MLKSKNFELPRAAMILLTIARGYVIFIKIIYYMGREKRVAVIGDGGWGTTLAILFPQDERRLVRVRASLPDIVERTLLVFVRKIEPSVLPVQCPSRRVVCQRRFLLCRKTPQVIPSVVFCYHRLPWLCGARRWRNAPVSARTVRCLVDHVIGPRCHTQIGSTAIQLV